MRVKKQQKANQQILNTIPIFLAKTYKIVDNPQYFNTISWSQDGQSFIVKDINKLTTDIFPKHFKHSNFASFVRQLNMYGFHKIKSQEQGHTFYHQSFQKNQIQKLIDIKRKNGNANDSQQGNQSNMMVPLRRSPDTQIQKQLNSIRNKHQDLQSFVSMLVDQNKQILMQNRTFVNKMSKMQQKYRNKLQNLMFLLLFGKGKNNNGQPFILPQQFQNMLQSFQQKTQNKNLQFNQQLQKCKKMKLQLPLMMLKNVSQAQIQKTKQIDQKQKDQLSQLIQELDNKNGKILQMDDSLGLIPPSPNQSFISFPQIYDKIDQNQMSQFLEKLQNSDYQDCI